MLELCESVAEEAWEEEWDELRTGRRVVASNTPVPGQTQCTDARGRSARAALQREHCWRSGGLAQPPCAVTALPETPRPLPLTGSRGLQHAPSGHTDSATTLFDSRFRARCSTRTAPQLCQEAAMELCLHPQPPACSSGQAARRSRSLRRRGAAGAAPRLLCPPLCALGESEKGEGRLEPPRERPPPARSGPSRIP